MNQALAIQEIALTLAANNFHPTVINSDFLKYTGIVPADWELARPPAYTNSLAQLVFNIFLSPKKLENLILSTNLVR